MKKMNNKNMARFACTTMIVGKDASADGSVIVSHSDDDVSDARVVRVPSLSYAAGDFRPVYYDNCSVGANLEYNCNDIRRYIGKSRGPVYDTVIQDKLDYKNKYNLDDKLCWESKPLGKIPQDPNKESTFAYYDGSYGIMNEKNLMIGECTCGAKIQPNPEPNKRIFYAAELSRVALERCSTAREAIELIASLIANYGYYGTGETLLLGDSTEAWVMEMCGYKMDGTDGIWVAQRVPDDEYFVAANEFRIRDVARNPADNQTAETAKTCYFESATNSALLYSSNLFNACEDNKWIEPNATTLDWLPTVSYGEYSHPYYSLRRVWRAFSKVAPLAHLPAKVENGYTRAYPFSLKPEKKLSVLDVAGIYRDHYEGTPFDMTVGPASGPFRNPVRYEGNPDQGDSFNLNTYHVSGAWERPLSIYRCGMFWINQAKQRNGQVVGVSWNAPDRPVANCLMPLYSQMIEIPSKLETMNVLDFEFNGDSAWWAFNFVANLANQNFEYMMKEVISLQGNLEAAAAEFVSDAFRSGDIKALSQSCTDNVETVLKKWWNLATTLIVKFNDGCITTGPTSIMQPIDYPKDWLKMGGYFDGPTEY